VICYKWLISVIILCVYFIIINTFGSDSSTMFASSLRWLGSMLASCLIEEQHRVSCQTLQVAQLHRWTSCVHFEAKGQGTGPQVGLAPSYSVHLKVFLDYQSCPWGSGHLFATGAEPSSSLVKRGTVGPSWQSLHSSCRSIAWSEYFAVAVANTVDYWAKMGYHHPLHVVLGYVRLSASLDSLVIHPYAGKHYCPYY